MIKSEVHIDQFALLLGFLLTVWMTYKIIKRSRQKSKETIGCVTVGYIYVIVASISVLAIGGTMALSTMIIDRANILYSGEKHEAKIISYTRETRYSFSQNRDIIMYTPSVEFTSSDGKILVFEIDYSSNEVPQIGDRQKVYYDKVNEQVTTVGFGVIALLIGGTIMIGILVYLFVGMLFYALNRSMVRYKEVGLYIGLVIIIPLLMIAFDGVLLYTLMNSHGESIWVSAILVFFIFVLTLSVIGYFKTILKSDNKESKLSRKNGQ